MVALSRHSIFWFNVMFIATFMPFMLIHILMFIINKYIVRKYTEKQNEIMRSIHLTLLVWYLISLVPGTAFYWMALDHEISSVSDHDWSYLLSILMIPPLTFLLAALLVILSIIYCPPRKNI